ncbi:innexin shaking-B-like [Copidosoma floridanum]|uniref:innexin shaking-B-like n=1 Tax=Copidosoma floridanum TaxID=29053 RepID=UPI000C6F8CC4|nr:innexin shaking-B-like [Copidosoma floridanum]
MRSLAHRQQQRKQCSLPALDHRATAVVVVLPLGPSRRRVRAGEEGVAASEAHRRQRSAWIRLGRSKRDRRHETWIMDALRGLYCLFNVSKVQTDGFVSRLHVFTAILLLAFFAMVSMKQCVGNPIDCVHTRDIPVEAFNAYCWIHSTYFVTGAMLGVAGVNVAFPGVGSTLLYQHRQRVSGHQSGDRSGPDSITRQVKYYQWVPFLLIFQV